VISIDGSLIRGLVLTAGMALAGVSAFEPMAAAQKAYAQEEDGEEDGEDEKKKPGENGKKNGEDEEDEKGGWELAGWLNRGMIVWNDGKGSSAFSALPGLGFGNQRQRGVRFVDNDQDNSGAEAEYKFGLGQGWTGVIKFNVEGRYASTEFVDQFDRDGQGVDFKLNETLFELGHNRFGKFSVGLQDSASDGTSDINLAGANVVSDAEVDNWNNSFFLRTAGIGLTPLRWGDFFAGPDVGDTGIIVKYFTPKFLGFEAGVSVGQPLDIWLFTPPSAAIENATAPLETEHKKNGLLTDFGIRYNKIWFDAFHVRAGLGIFRNTAEEEDAEEPTQDTGWGASFAILHLHTGLNFAINSGAVKHTDQCIEPGALSGKCRGQDRFLYLKGGVLKNFFGWGNTALYGEYYKGWLTQNLSDDEQLPFLEANPGQAVELEKSVMNVWGLGMVQTIDRSPTRHYTTDLYVGYRNYSLDVSLLGADGASVPTRPISDWSAILAGVRFRWGKEERYDPLRGHFGDD
jgi:hypothetical protein